MQNFKPRIEDKLKALKRKRRGAGHVQDTAGSPEPIPRAVPDVPSPPPVTPIPLTPVESEKDEQAPQP